MPPRSVTVSLILISSVAACARDPAAESSSVEVPRTAIEAQLNQPDVGILLGDVRFVAGRTEADKGREALNELPLYRALAQVGAITIRNERELTPSSGRSDSAAALIRAGVR